ncbi:MAG: gamma carbonic anhydrase family protein [Halieaceae bacterium]|jgi:carbonic anhydrase/acetyltransferase-like protein (isoleucine patch superfamily)|nr:gamma carbonic anhydrase family protein [Halieaceae bacterium]
MLYSLDGTAPVLEGGGHFIAPTAAVVGAVHLGDGSSVWFGAVIRGDNEPIVIGARSNIQDGSVLHSDPGFPLHIGANVTVGHNAMLHGCSIGDGTLVGINAVVLNGAKVGRNCVIGANSLVPEGMEIPDGSLVVGSPAKIKRELSEEQQAFFSRNADHYVDNAARFAAGLQPVGGD